MIIDQLERAGESVIHTVAPCGNGCSFLCVRMRVKNVVQLSGVRDFVYLSVALLMMADCCLNLLSNDFVDEEVIQGIKK